MAKKSKVVTARDTLMKDSFKLAKIQPLNEKQASFLSHYSEGRSHVLAGSAGAGKTFLALYSAFNEILNDKKSPYRRIAIVRSAVSTRDIGHLPGTLEEKSAIYEIPYVGICTELFGRADAYGIFTKKAVIKFMLTSYVRGITLDNTIIIVDEYQNMTAHELDSVMTRLGQGSKILFCGDTKQTDFTKASDKDHEKFFKVLNKMDNYFEFTEFTTEDIVRSGIVKAYIIAKENKK